MNNELRMKIMEVAMNSPLRRYYWRDRGDAPTGYIKGMAVAFAQCYLDLKAGSSAAKEMAKPIGNPTHDALAYYAPQLRAANMMDEKPVDVLRHTFVLMYGLGMRESSGVFGAGRDMNADNASANTAEAGLFQQSWDSHVCSREIAKLLDKYSSNGISDCTRDVFAEGVHDPIAYSVGRGAGRLFQDTTKKCPLFAVSACAIGLRNLRKHWGPIGRKEVELRQSANKLLLQVQVLVDASPSAEPELVS